MSKGKTPNIDDLSPVQNSNNEDEVEELELEPGDSFVGEVRSIERGLSVPTSLPALTVRASAVPLSMALHPEYERS